MVCINLMYGGRMNTILIVLAIGLTPIIGMIIQVMTESYIEKPVKKDGQNE